MPFQVFVKLDSQGAQTVPISDLDLDDTVAVLIQKLADKEGKENKAVTLVYRAKQLSDHNKKLKDLGIHNGSVIFAAFRVIGGMSIPHPTECEGVVTTNKSDDTSDDVGDGPAIRRYNKTEAQKFGIRSTNTPCMLYTSDGCGMASVSKLMFKGCDHSFCADCIFRSLKDSICYNKKTSLSCPDTGCGEAVDIDTAFVAAALTKEEILKFETQLNENYLLIVCPNKKCQAYLLMDGVEENKVQCRKCNGAWFCKICNIGWPANSESYMICGNVECNSAGAIFEALTNCVRKDFCDYGAVEKNVPTLRVCIKCQKYVYWAEDCKHATCPNEQCKYKFCFVCLAPGHDCDLDKACTVKEQTSIFG